MPEGDSFSGVKTASDDDSDGRIWQRLKTMFFGRDHEPTLREQLEEAIAEHEEDSDDRGEPDNDGDLTAVERTMLRNLLHFSEHRVDDVMVTRSDIIAIDESASFAECVAAFAEHGHSRLPVYRDSLDSITGMIHIKDIFAVLAEGRETPDNLEAFIRQPRFVPQNMSVLALLDEMRRTRTHLAIVLDEYSGTEGLVTIEDLVEEIVGEIEDEHDDEPEEMLFQISPGMWEADARVELDDLAEAIDAKLAEVDEDVDTLGGLAFVIAGQVPNTGQMLLHEASGWRLEIIEADDKRVFKIRLFAPTSPEEDENA
ncbi:MAG TPA: hemolysin family protein [Sphingorhabdus lacus]|jgi:CBS domain containing-hemolysin-like protein|uniref:hemolysin family protein n=1 Tax=Sphingorhabdus lacus TaxID=392610 RepID=UPI002C9C9B26|nr:hemolysin family protein [Sphingorhabdus lacus]HPV67201.1 hemolysin family protein [Sphingorhabdus lacus]